jgi:chloramphenicol O-acetyltransferase
MTMTNKDQKNLYNIYQESFYNDNQFSEDYPDFDEAWSAAVGEYGENNVRKTIDPHGKLEIIVRSDSGWIDFWSEDGWDGSTHRNGAGWS